MSIKINLLKTFFLISAFLIFSGLRASSLDEVWKALEKNDRKLARTLLTEAIKDENTKLEASMTLIFLNSLEGNEKNNLDLMKASLPLMNDPSSYLFSFWFDYAVTDGYSKKTSRQLKYLQDLLVDQRINTSIKAGDNYVIGLHYEYLRNFKNRDKAWSNLKSLKNWQYTGPFNNTSGSGFDKTYGPLEHPEPDAKFTSKTNAEIQWFTPEHPQASPWNSSIYFVPADQAVVYMQTFVTSPSDMDVVLAYGGNGSFKVWYDDQLMMEQEEEKQTELDICKQAFHLKKGDNRILIQLGFTDKTDFPNFIVRILDPNGVPVEGLVFSDKYRPYNKASKGDLGKSIPHFAEVFFEKKIAEQPDNVLYYLLLSKAYYRRQMNNKAIEILKKVQVNYPNNILVNYELMLNYLKMEDRTEILKQIEHIRALDPSFIFLALYDFEIYYKNENYEECEKLLNKIKVTFGKEDEKYLNYEIRYLLAKKDYQTMYKTIDMAYRKYPENVDFLSYEFQILKNTKTTAIQPYTLLENYLSKNYSAKINEYLVDEYKNLALYGKLEKHLLKLHEMYPEEKDFIDDLTSFYYSTKDYKKSLKWIDYGLTNAPYYPIYWENRGYVNDAMSEKENAISDFYKSIQYNPNLFDAREMIRQLQDKKPIMSFFRDSLIYETISDDLKKIKKTDDNYQYLFNEKNLVVFPEGASVEFVNAALVMQNEAGLKDWNEVNISYNEYSQRLIVDKAEVIKKNGQKVEAEQNYSQLVFPSLEIDDVIYVSYRIENYTGGKLAKEFWEDWVFNDFVPVNRSVFRLFVPKGYKFNIVNNNIGSQPVKGNIDDFETYEWKFVNPPKCKDEDYMPPINEVGMGIHLSTVSNWKTIADWYSDIAIPQAKEDYNVSQVYDQIFSNKNYKTDFDKAKAIYDYICKNIRYSSVSFRQSNYTPQKPMVTISTQLGDCKDLSTLYQTLAKKAGLKTHLVLVNTRDNGEENLKIPSIDFNHCIIKIDLDRGTMFQELTDEKLSFGSIPTNVINAQALIIPNSINDSTVGRELIHIPDNTYVPNQMIRKTRIKIIDNDLKVNTKFSVQGNNSSGYREKYSGLTNDQQKDNIKTWLNKNFANNLILDSFWFDYIDNNDSNFNINAECKVEGEVKNIGGMTAIKVPLFEKIFNTGTFTQDERKYPIIYWSYEDVDYYETQTIMEFPKGAILEKLPENVHINNKFIDYSLVAVKLPNNSVMFTRKVKTHNNTFSPDYYKEFRETIKKVLKAEDVYIGYK